jgi:hypothetical protein
MSVVAGTLAPTTCAVVFKGRPPCRRPAGWGTDHYGFGPCKNHGGSMPQVAQHHGQAMAVAQAMSEITRLGGAPPADPEQALLDLVSQSAALSTFYGQQVAILAEREPGGRKGFNATAGQDYEKGSGLFGPEIDVDKSGTEHIVGEQIRGMVALWNEERDRLAKYARAALAAGIEKRRVEMAEQQGQTIVLVINNVLIKLGLTPEVIAQARTLLAAEFRQIAAGEPG